MREHTGTVTPDRMWEEAKMSHQKGGNEAGLGERKWEGEKLRRDFLPIPQARVHRIPPQLRPEHTAGLVWRPQWPLIRWLGCWGCRKQQGEGACVATSGFKGPSRAARGQLVTNDQALCKPRAPPE